MEAESARLAKEEAEKRIERARPIQDQALPELWRRHPGFGAGCTTDTKWAAITACFHKARVFNLASAREAQLASKRQVELLTPTLNLTLNLNRIGQVELYEDCLVAEAGLEAAECMRVRAEKEAQEAAEEAALAAEEAAAEKARKRLTLEELEELQVAQPASQLAARCEPRGRRGGLPDVSSVAVRVTANTRKVTTRTLCL